MSNKKTKTERLLAYLRNGYDITDWQAYSRFDIQNLSAQVSYLRKLGFAVYRNRKNINGSKVGVYRLGTPTRAVVAAGFGALAESR